MLSEMLYVKMEEAETSLLRDMPTLENETLRNLCVVALDRVLVSRKSDLPTNLIHKKFGCSEREAEEYLKTIAFFGSLIGAREEVYEQLVRETKKEYIAEIDEKGIASS